MKKLYFLLLPLLLLTGYAAQSQCTNASAFGSAVAPTNATPVTISTCSFQQEYSTITAVVAGNRYVVTGSIAGTFITMRFNAPAGTVVACGVTPLQFTAPCSGTYYAHWNTNSACGTAATCMTTTIACSSCGAAASQCTMASAFASVAAPTTINVPLTITTCSFQSEYATVTGAVANRVYLVGASIAGTFITIHQGTAAGPVIASGVAPLAFTATAAGSYFLHWNTNSACGTASVCMTTTITYIADAVCAGGAPINDLCTGALPITCASTVTGNTSTATIDAVATCVTTLNTAPGVWYSFVGTGQTVTMSLCGSGYDTKIGVFSGTCAALVCVTGNDDFCGLQSQVSFPSVLGTTYYVLITGFGTATGAFTLATTCASAIPNDLCTGALPIACGQTITGTTVGSGIDATTPTCVTTLNTAGGIWYTMVGNGANNTLTMCGSGYDTKIGVFTGTCAALVCVTGNDDFCGLQSQVTFPTTLGTTYYVIVTGFGAATGTFTLTRTSDPLPNDVCTGAITINCGQTITGSTACGATLDAVGTCVTTLNTAPGLWYTFVGDGSPVTMSLCGSSYDTKIGIFTGTCTSLTCVTGNDDFCGLQSQATFNTNAGFTYYILVTGFGTASGNFTLVRTCAPPCAGVPSPGAIAPVTSTACVGNNVTLTCSGYSANSQLIFQWSSAPAAAGPYTVIGGATSNVYTFAAPAATTYYRCTVTCTNGNGNATTAPVVVNVSNIQYISFGATPSTVCSPGSVNITATVTGGLNLGNYTYTLTGPGTIGAPVYSGPNNSSVSFSVTNIPAGNQSYTITATDPVPCSRSQNINVTVNLTPTVTLTSSYAATASYTGPAVAIPDNVPAGVDIPLTVSGLIGNITDLDFRFDAAPTGICDATVGNANAAMDHTFIGDLVFKLTSPLGTTVTIVNRRGGTRENICTTLLDDDGGYPSLSTVTSITGSPLSGNFAPDNPLSAFDGQNGNGIWKLNVSDNASADIGSMRRFSLIFTTAPANTICNGTIISLNASVSPSGTVAFSPLTDLYTDANATVPYTGTQVNSVFAKPTVSRTYTAASTSPLSCVGTSNISITVNQLPAITVQPGPTPQTVCPGVSVNYTVGATGTGLTYQWRRNTTALVDGGQISGATTATLTIGNVSVANNGTYDCVVSGVCPPPAISAGAVLFVAAPPTLTGPANATICSIPGSPTVLTTFTSVTFTVATTGSVPPPLIFQWQVSTTGAGGPWTNLANSATVSASPFYGGVFTNTLTIANAPVSLNNNQYRVVATNSCGQFTNSVGGILTVNASPVVTATDLFAQRICISDTLIPLVGTPVGGAWTGIGVSGFNFVPPVTGVGAYTLTYTYTNPAGCTVTDTTLVKVQDCPERLRELTDEGAVIIYPNPSNGHFTIRLRSTLYNYLGVRTYDMGGHLMVGNAVEDPVTKRDHLVTPVYTGLYYGRTIPIDLSRLASGTYLLVIYYDDGIRTTKKGFTVVIEK